MVATIFITFAIVGSVAAANHRLSSLPSCNGCYSGVNGVNYECCSDMTINNGVCACSGAPCTQCAPSTKDKEKVLPLTSLPSCGDCYSGFNGVDYRCADCSISINNGNCVCGDGSSCVQCVPSAKEETTFISISSGTRVMVPKLYLYPTAISGSLSFNGSDMKVIYANGLALGSSTLIGCGGPATLTQLGETYAPQLVTQISSCSQSSFELSVFGLGNSVTGSYFGFDHFVIDFAVQGPSSFQASISGWLSNGSTLPKSTYSYSNCVPSFIGYNSPAPIIFNFNFCFQ